MLLFDRFLLDFKFRFLLSHFCSALVVALDQFLRGDTVAGQFVE